MTQDQSQYTVIVLEQGIPVAFYSVLRSDDGEDMLSQQLLEDINPKALSMVFQMITNPMLHPALRVKGMIIEEILRNELQQDMKRDIPW